MHTSQGKTLRWAHNVKQGVLDLGESGGGAATPRTGAPGVIEVGVGRNGLSTSPLETPASQSAAGSPGRAFAAQHDRWALGCLASSCA